MRGYKDFEELAPNAGPEDLGGDDLELILLEVDRAIMITDARLDEPGRRFCGGLPPEEAGFGPGSDELSLAAAELIDAYPSIHAELEHVGNRIRTHGVQAAASELAGCRHLVDLVRLSLEGLFSACPDSGSYASWAIDDEFQADLRSPEERYSAYRRILDMLRRNVN